MAFIFKFSAIGNKTCTFVNILQSNSFTSIFITFTLGSKSPIDCPAGYFTNTTTSATCQICPEGFYCVPENVTAGDPKSGYHQCPEGYYCPNGTGLDWKPCPRGTYSNSKQLHKASQCKDCDAGRYCGELHATSTTADCLGGYYCVRRVDRPDPVSTLDGSSLYGNCSAGKTRFKDVTSWYICTICQRRFMITA